MANKHESRFEQCDHILDVECEIRIGTVAETSSAGFHKIEVVTNSQDLQWRLEVDVLNTGRSVSNVKERAKNRLFEMRGIRLVLLGDVSQTHVFKSSGLVGQELCLFSLS